METFHSPTLKASTKVINVTTNKASEQAQISIQLQAFNTLFFFLPVFYIEYKLFDKRLRKYSDLFDLITLHRKCSVQFYGYIFMTKKYYFNGENNRLYPVLVVSGGKRKKLLPNTTVSTLTKYLEIHCKVMFQSYLSFSEKSFCMH